MRVLLIFIISLKFVYNNNIHWSCICPNTKIHPQDIYCQSDFVILGKLIRYWDRYVYISLLEKFKTSLKLDKLHSNSQFWFLELETDCYQNLHIGENYLISGIIDNSILKVTICSYFEYVNQLSSKKRVLLTESYVKSCSCKIKECERKLQDNTFGILTNNRYMSLKGIAYENGLKAYIKYFFGDNTIRDSCCISSENLMINYTCLPEWSDGSCVWTVNK